MARRLSYPLPQYEANVAYIGNHLLRAFAGNMTARGHAHRMLFLDRDASMYSTPKIEDSPCFHFHSYGQITDLHVRLGLTAGCMRLRRRLQV